MTAFAASKPALLRIVLIVLIVLSLGRSIGIARDRGMDTAIQMLDFHIVATTIAISQVYHGAPGSYLGYPTVDNAFVGVAASADRAELERLRIADIRPAYRAAIGVTVPLDEKTNGPFFVQDTPNDIGYVDFISFALRLLDRGPESLYLFYFLFLSLSVVLFLVANFQRLDALAWLALTLIASELVIAQSTVFNEARNQLYNVHDYRFVSTLAIVPALHLAALATSDARFGMTSLLTTIVQGILLALAVWFRSSALWVVVGLIFLWLVTWMPRLSLQSPEHRLARSLILGTAAAAAIITINGLERRIDPDYVDPTLTTSYLRWHAAYVGLASDAETWHRRKSSRQVDGLEDLNGNVAAEEVIALQRLDPARLVRPHGGYAWKWYDETLRRLTIDYLLSDPVAALRLYLWHKPLRFLFFLGPELLRTLSGSAVGIGLALAGILTAAVSMATVAGDRPARRTVVPALIFAAASAVPPIFAYTLEHGMADQVLICLWAIFLLAASGIAISVRRHVKGAES